MSTSDANPGGRPVLLSLRCNPPSVASSVYAASEAPSDDTASTATGTTLSYTSTLGDFDYPNYDSAANTYFSRGTSNTLPTNPNVYTPLPLLQLADGDTLIFLTHPPSARLNSAAPPPLRVFSSALLSSGSAVFHQCLQPEMQKRILSRLVKQKKILKNGLLPPNIRHVLDLTPEDEGDRAVEWQEKLWCPKSVLDWKSSLQTQGGVSNSQPQYNTTSSENLSDALKEYQKIQRKDLGLEEDGQTQDSRPKSSSQTNLEPYTFARHIIALERLVHILHGLDPLVRSAVDWYTLHALSAAFGTLDATRDYTARWIYGNYPMIVETQPELIWEVSIVAGLSAIAADAWSAAAMKTGSSYESSKSSIPGVDEAATSLYIRARKEFRDLLDGEWIEQYLPGPTQSSASYTEFKAMLQTYVRRCLEDATAITGISTVSAEETRANTRTFWQDARIVHLCEENQDWVQGLAPHMRHLFEFVLDSWTRLEKESDGDNMEQNEDIWKNILSSKPTIAIPRESIAPTESQEDASSEFVTANDPEMVVMDEKDDTESVDTAFTLIQEMKKMGGAVSNASQAEASQPHFVPEENTIFPVDNTTTGVSTGEANARVQHAAETSTQSLPLIDVFHTLEPQDEPPIQTGFSGDLSTTYPTQEAIPKWLSDQLAKLTADNAPAEFWAVLHHPGGDVTKFPEPRIRCIDCPNMLYFPGPGKSLDNFNIHLQNSGHLTRILQRERTSVRFQPFTRQPPIFPSIILSRIEVPNGLLNILMMCQNHVRSHCDAMCQRNIGFDALLLEDRLACFEEAERSHMPIWAGGEAIVSDTSVSSNSKGKGVRFPPAGSDTSSELMSAIVSSAGVGEEASSISSFSDLGDSSASASTGEGSVISVDEFVQNTSSDDDWIMEDEDADAEDIEGLDFDEDDDNAEIQNEEKEMRRPNPDKEKREIDRGAVTRASHGGSSNTVELPPSYDQSERDIVLTQVAGRDTT